MRVRMCVCMLVPPLYILHKYICNPMNIYTYIDVYMYV